MTRSRLSASPGIDAKGWFEFLFQYPCPVQIKVDSLTEIGGSSTATICLGDGVGAYLEQQGNGTGYSLLYFDEDFLPPYDLLETQDYHPSQHDFDHLFQVDYSWLSDRQITEADIQAVDQQMLFILYHSIYARKGLIFYNNILESVFKQQSWYCPRYSTAEFKTARINQLTPIEQFNAKFLKSRFLSKL
ncbi:serine/threonine protein kinase [Leptolyngbya sp. NIES-3755]|nr:serine/threonine protein kinase [Leptolyngbya sp. NIES-3755]